MAARRKTSKKPARRKKSKAGGPPPIPERGYEPTAKLAGWFAAYNPRTISDHDFDVLKASLLAHNCIQEVAINRRTAAAGWPKRSKPCVVGGHQRIRAALEVGIDSTPVVWIDVDEITEQLLNVQLNRTGGQFDIPSLTGLLDSLRERGADLAKTGLDTDELKSLLAEKARDAQPSGFEDVTPGTVKHEYQCPKCGHKWKGKAA